MTIKPRQNGLIAICQCGAKQFLPAATIAKGNLLYCPCGHLHPITNKDLNAVTSRSIRGYIYAATGKHPKPPRIPQSILQQTGWFESMD
jgi:hypothetical protein